MAGRRNTPRALKTFEYERSLAIFWPAWRMVESVCSKPSIQPRLGIVDVDNAGVPVAAIRATLNELPMAGTLLLPGLASPGPALI